MRLLQTRVAQVWEPDLTVDSHVTIWVEPDLTRSMVELARG